MDRARTALALLAAACVAGGCVRPREHEREARLAPGSPLRACYVQPAPTAPREAPAQRPLPSRDPS